MRRKPDLTPNRYRSPQTSGSNKFISSFHQHETSKGIVEKRDRKYNWIGYKYAIGFTVVLGFLTYLLLDYFMF